MIPRAALDRVTDVREMGVRREIPPARLRMYEVEIAFEDTAATVLRVTVSAETLFAAGAAAMSLVLQIGEVAARQFKLGLARVRAVQEI